MTAVKSWPGAIVGRGNAFVLRLIADQLSERFSTFDDAIDGIEFVIGDTVDRLPPQFDCNFELVIAGFSAGRARPELYLICGSDEMAPGAAETIKQQRALGKAVFFGNAFKLTPLPDLVVGPVPTVGMVLSAHYEGIDVDDPPERVICGLRMVIEMQRHDNFPGTAFHSVGGRAELTTVSIEGVEQRIISEWPEDEIGKPINPKPIDWAAWRIANGNPLPSADTAIERLPPTSIRREMMERKKRKAARRLAR